MTHRRHSNLDLVLTHYWFDKIFSGEKTVEYRKITPMWIKRIWDRRRELSTVTLRRGYSSDTLIMMIENIDAGECPIPGWDGIYIRIGLGERVGGTYRKSDYDRPRDN